VQLLHAVGKDEGGEDVERRLLAHAREGAEQHFGEVAAQHLDERLALDPLLFQDLAEHRRLQDAEPDPEADRHQHDAEQERHPPAPGGEGVPGDGAEGEHREIGEEQAGRHAPLRPGGDEATVLVGARPLHREQHRAAPLAAHADPLQEAQDGEDDRAPDADARIGRHDAHRKRPA
jgi:hypothetical protein